MSTSPLRSKILYKEALASVVALICVVAVSYAASIRMGFYTDDYTYLQYAARLSVPQYLSEVLDPRASFMTYRPLLRLLFLLEYQLWSFEPTYYHLVQVLFHLGNCLLLFRIIWELSNRWRFAFLSALLYACMPVYSWAVFWIAVHDPVATLFYLGAIWFWILYLKTSRSTWHVLALGTLVFALLGKETSITAPVAFFLIDRWFIRSQADRLQLLRRYAPILFVLVAYGILEYTYQSNGIFVTEGKYSIGPQILSNLSTYVSMLMVPSGWEWATLWPLIVIIAYIAIMVTRRSRALAFVAIMVLLNIAPVLAIPWTIQGRYLYVAAMGPAIIMAMILDLGGRAGAWRGYSVISAVILTGLIVNAGQSLSIDGEVFSEIARQKRVPLRDIMRQHPDLPSGTLLYLLEPPGSIPDIQGMMFQRYGDNVLVRGTFEDGMSYAGGILRQQLVRLRDYPLPLVYYFADDNHPVEIRVDRNASATMSAELPARLNVPIRLESLELTNTNLKRGNSAMLLLYWRALGQVDRDYTVFVHLIDANGQIIEGHDNAPRNDKERTSTWRANRLTADGHIFSIPSDTPAGSIYRLEVGMYYLPTMERLVFVDAAEHVIADHLTIGPIVIED